MRDSRSLRCHCWAPGGQFVFPECGGPSMGWEVRAVTGVFFFYFFTRSLEEKNTSLKCIRCMFSNKTSLRDRVC